MCTNDRKHAHGWQSTEDMLPPENVDVLAVEDTGMVVILVYKPEIEEPLSNGWCLFVPYDGYMHVPPPKYWLHLPEVP